MRSEPDGVAAFVNDQLYSDPVLVFYTAAQFVAEIIMRDMSHEDGEPSRRAPSRNVLGGPLAGCSMAPLTGFFRDGCCNTSPQDVGSHTVCIVATEAFLAFSKSRGNDLSTPRPEFGFAGLRPGNRWCLCAPRWQEAFAAGLAPKVVLGATHAGALRYCTLADLKSFAVDLN